jgi:hypothetical protein
VRFLIDSALSPALAALLQQSGHDASHVRDLGLQHADDEVIFERAAAEHRIVVSADADFGTLLAMRSSRRPSVTSSAARVAASQRHWRERCSRTCPSSSTPWITAASSRSSQLGSEFACFRSARARVTSRPRLTALRRAAQVSPGMQRHPEVAQVFTLSPTRMAKSSSGSVPWPEEAHFGLGRRGSLVRIQSPRYHFSGAILSLPKGRPDHFSRVYSGHMGDSEIPGHP